MTTDPIRRAAERLLFDLDALCDSSQGVAGLHQNGDLAPWSELLEGGRFCSWLGDAITGFRDALAAAPPEPEPVGEVGELVQWLEKHYEYANELGRPDWAQNSHRAAALLRQLSATPQQPAPGEGEGLTDGPAVPEGRMWCAGVGKGTGLPADLLLVDDPIKGREEAESAAHRRQVHNKPAVVVGELSDEALLNLWASSPRIDEPHGGIAFDLNDLHRRVAALEAALLQLTSTVSKAGNEHERRLEALEKRCDVQLMQLGDLQTRHHRLAGAVRRLEAEVYTDQEEQAAQQAPHPAPEAGEVADDELMRVFSKALDVAESFNASLLAVYNHGRQHGAAQARCPHIVSSDEETSYCALAEQGVPATVKESLTAHPAPAGGLVERVADAIVAKATSAGIVDDRPARAAIREVAAWLDAKGQHGCSLWLREEADRG